jgi:hypothetical protein
LALNSCARFALASNSVPIADQSVTRLTQDMILKPLMKVTTICLVINLAQQPEVYGLNCASFLWRAYMLHDSKGFYYGKGSQEDSCGAAVRAVERRMICRLVSGSVQG